MGILPIREVKATLTTEAPLVSVIMPVRNEAEFIARSLGAVLDQDYPADKMEILVADGLSTDGTVDLIKSLPGAERIQVIGNERQIQTAGLNSAIRQAKGEILVHVDGHVVIAPDYVRECVRALSETGASNVGGPMKPIGVTPMGKAIAAAGTSAFAVPSAFHVSPRAQYTDTVYLGAWPRQVLEKVGNFNESLDINNDYELNYRIRQAGGKIYMTPAIRSEYFGRQSLKELARQYFRYGRWKVQMLRQYPRSMRPRQLVAPMLVAGIIVGFLLALFSPIVRALWASEICAYSALALFFSYRTAARTDWSVFWRLPLVFLTIHLAWGSGFWVGLFAPPNAKPF